MIFLTVGTQLPFERLVKAIDEWAADNTQIPVFAQIGTTEYKPKHLEVTEGLSPGEYQEKFNAASVVVSHVGMGTIISGLDIGKPMVLMPRQAALGEHRNDHQLATARKFERFELIDVAHDTSQLFAQLNTRLMRLQNSQENTQENTQENSQESSEPTSEQTTLKVSPGLTERLTLFLNEVKGNAK